MHAELRVDLSMTVVKRNVLANLVGSAWTALVGLAFTPLYIRFVGIEAYGLIGFCLMLQVMLLVLDLGLSPTINRVLARGSANLEKATEIRDFVRTAEAVSWATGVSVGILLYLISPLVSRSWIHGSTISPDEIRRTLGVICINLALLFPLGFYQGGLMGLQKQVLANSLRIAASTAAGGGAVLVLWKLSATVAAFFAWQAAVTLTQVAVTMALLWRNLPVVEPRPARLAFGLFRNVWRFAAGMTGISVSALVLTQMDKVILSKILSLKAFGYYTLAGVVSSGLYVLIAPVYGAVFPRFSELVALRRDDDLAAIYHRGAQFMAILVLPVASVIAFFPSEILVLWTRDPEVAAAASPIVAALTAGTALNGLMHLPYALQLAYGWTRIGVAINLFLIAVLLPATIILAKAYGALGGAVVWPAVNILYIFVGVPLTHRRILKGHARTWAKEDFLVPMAAAVGVSAAGRALLHGPLPPLTTAAFLAAVLCCAAAAAAVAARHAREWLVELKRTIATSNS